ncbi:hypothetical protein J3F84DRAFT_390596 [Trichoderma pleuroticola]
MSTKRSLAMIHCLSWCQQYALAMNYTALAGGPRHKGWTQEPPPNCCPLVSTRRRETTHVVPEGMPSHLPPLNLKVLLIVTQQHEQAPSTPVVPS